MNLATKYDIPVKCVWLEDLNPYPGEIFLNPPEDILVGILPYYLVSNYGRVYNVYTKSFIGSVSNTTRYIHLLLSAYPKPINIDLHRLILLTFNPVQNWKDLQVNHKDGNKLNNRLDNLEWVTPSQNIQHAYSNSLMNHYSVLSQEQVIRVCELLQTGKYTNKEIADMTGCAVHNVNDIKQNKWNSITKDYNFSYKTYRAFDENDAHKICQYFAANPRINGKTKAQHCRDVIQYAGVDESTFDSVRKIYDRKQYTHISNQYDFI